MYQCGAQNIFIALELSPRQHNMIHDLILTYAGNRWCSMCLLYFTPMCVTVE